MMWTPAQIRHLRVDLLRMGRPEFGDLVEANRWTVWAWETRGQKPRPYHRRKLQETLDAYSRRQNAPQCTGHPLCDGRLIYC